MVVTFTVLAIYGLLWMAWGRFDKLARWPCAQRTAHPIRCCAWRGMQSMF